MSRVCIVVLEEVEDDEPSPLHSKTAQDHVSQHSPPEAAAQEEKVRTTRTDQGFAFYPAVLVFCFFPPFCFCFFFLYRSASSFDYFDGLCSLAVTVSDVREKRGRNYSTVGVFFFCCCWVILFVLLCFLCPRHY